MIKTKKGNEEEGKHYFETDAFSYLAKVSNEKVIQKNKIIKILKKIPKKENYLDVGAGAGDISFDIAKKFKKSVLVEPGDKMFKILKKRAKKNKSIRLIKSNWEDFYLKNKKKYTNKFDLITLVHVVYFLKPLKEKLDEILRFLSPKGKLIIICPTGKNDRKSFYAIRQKLLKKPFEAHPDFADIPKMFPKKLTHYDINSRTKLRAFNEMEKNPLSEKNKPTNYYLKFAIKKEFRELILEEKKKILEYIKKYQKKDYYYIPGDSRVYVIEKEK